jgi:hypothetical protein
VDPLPNLLAKWKRSQKKAITNLKSRCGKTAFGLVKDIQTIDDLFEMLKAEFKPKGEGAFISGCNWTVRLQLFQIFRPAPQIGSKSRRFGTGYRTKMIEVKWIILIVYNARQLFPESSVL